ncbi:DNA-3-methyladenine glycosylase I [Jannaschia faecimaris]|uniref:DNA-3-methyladenine glycosylase I n=1 Tax=Jannaschia faecimaris TaxID=1244108 RepID=A0A1H3SJD0_9RHOB|nr:DNA-3-methyladenine glycosylase I [Jannaschia faecimaris]SDZ37209.1 DNA-3-methyladenine glycosylase I [Jannaschia faecimaris]
MTEFVGPDGEPRCKWCGAAPEFLDYHDREWGFPVSDDIRLFEKLCLESFQSGLSWRTILNKRDGFRAAFDGFDFHKIARYDASDIDRLLSDENIVRHRGKITAVINNAARAVEMTGTEGSLAAFFWGFEPKPEELGAPQTQSTSESSIALARELKRRGWKFLGPTTAFAFMQAMGLINDHSEGCAMRTMADDARRKFQRP